MKAALVVKPFCHPSFFIIMFSTVFYLTILVLFRFIRIFVYILSIEIFLYNFFLFKFVRSDLFFSFREHFRKYFQICSYYFTYIIFLTTK